MLRIGQVLEKYIMISNLPRGSPDSKSSEVRNDRA